MRPGRTSMFTSDHGRSRTASKPRILRACLHATPLANFSPCLWALVRDRCVGHLITPHCEFGYCIETGVSACLSGEESRESHYLADALVGTYGRLPLQC